MQHIQETPLKHQILVARCTAGHYFQEQEMYLNFLTQRNKELDKMRTQRNMFQMKQQDKIKARDLNRTAWVCAPSPPLPAVEPRKNRRGLLKHLLGSPGDPTCRAAVCMRVQTCNTRACLHAVPKGLGECSFLCSVSPGTGGRCQESPTHVPGWCEKPWVPSSLQCGRVPSCGLGGGCHVCQPH